MRTLTILQNLQISLQKTTELQTMTRICFYGAIAAVGLCLASLMLAVFSPYGEAAASVVRQAGLIVTLGILFAFGAVFVLHALQALHEVATYTSGHAEQPKALPAATLYDISPDVLVYRDPGENKTAYAERAKAAALKACAASWVVVCDFTDNVLTIARGTSGKNVVMYNMAEEEPFLSDLPENLRPPENAEVVPERYLRWFSDHFPAYARKERRAAASNVVELLDISAAVPCLFFLLFSVGLSAQSKARQVDESLGTRIREIPAAGVSVEFTFREGGREKTYNATGNGSSDYVSLLQSSALGLAKYSDEGGTLLYVRRGGEVVAKGVAVGDVATGVKSPYQFQPSTTGDPVRPRRLPSDEIGAPPEAFSLPDSAQMAERLDLVKDDILMWKARMWASIKPLWAFLMWVFGIVMWVILATIFVLRYIAGSAANESLVSIYGHVVVGRLIVKWQQNAAASCLVATWVIVVVGLLNTFLWMVWADVPLWLFVPAGFIITWAATKLTDFVVPDLRVTTNNQRGLQAY